VHALRAAENDPSVRCLYITHSALARGFLLEAGIVSQLTPQWSCASDHPPEYGGDRDSDQQRDEIYSHAKWGRETTFSYPA
jgi:hypothetical protein